MAKKETKVSKDPQYKSLMVLPTEKSNKNFFGNRTKFLLTKNFFFAFATSTAILTLHYSSTLLMIPFLFILIARWRYISNHIETNAKDHKDFIAEVQRKVLMQTGESITEKGVILLWSQAFVRADKWVFLLKASSTPGKAEIAGLELRPSKEKEDTETPS